LFDRDGAVEGHRCGDFGLEVRMSDKRLFSSLLLLAAPAFAQFPEKFTNLQVLPKTTSKAELNQIMRGFAFALGVRCNYCHAGKTVEGSPESLNFADDERETKRTARIMLRMVTSINTDYIGKLGATPSIEVECFTCHRGLDQPRTLQAVLAEALETKDIPSTIALYRDLRKKYYGGAQYDFSETSLNILTESLFAKSKVKEAVAIMELNSEVNNPLSGWGSNLIAMAHRANGETDKAIQDFKKILAADPENAWVKQQLAELESGKK
jgi:tetratricopeptide (TPR) repeat protein